MGILDDVLTKTKETMDVVGKKTGEVVSSQKIKFDISSLENKCEKDYARLGKLYYAEIKEMENIKPEAAAIIKSISDKSKKINQLNLELVKLNNLRICPNCGSAIEKSSNFCRTCGAKVTFVNDKKENGTEN